ncbi:hypothetical protein ABK040_001573 [Willaertia magna]
MQKYSLLLLIALCLFVIGCCFVVGNSESEIKSEEADKPFQFGDQKDIARINTCIGPCLKKYPGALEFIFKRSMKMSGLQVFFIGDYPKLTIYTPAQEVKEEIDIRDKTSEEIEEILVKAGCQFRPEIQ